MIERPLGGNLYGLRPGNRRRMAGTRYGYHDGTLEVLSPPYHTQGKLLYLLKQVGTEDLRNIDAA